MKYIIVITFLLPFCSFAQQSTTKAKESINYIMDDWHKAVAEYDAERYFGYMTETSRFLGTDESERWTKQEFKDFSMPYFNKQKTWDFTPTNRILFVSEDLKFAWFDEVLETWMGPCRGSGVMRLIDNKWKIEQYNLAVLVPNDKINSYLDIIGKSRKKTTNGED